MLSAVEHIKEEIRNLEPSDVEALLRDLQKEYVMPASDGESISVEAEWDAEIGLRVKEIEDGSAELISGAELRRGTAALLAQLTVKRSS